MTSGPLVFLLRCGAALTGSAFLALFLPVEWMVSMHLGVLTHSLVFAIAASRTRQILD